MVPQINTLKWGDMMKSKPINKAYLDFFKRLFQDKKFYSKLNKKINFNSKKIYENIKFMKIATILDNFSYQCFRHEFIIIPLIYESWLKQLKEQKPDLLLVESAWYGNKGSWKGKITNLGTSKDKSLEKLIKWCNHNNIPTVFWNKEDPGNFNFFKNTAKLFDFVFTTDINCVEKYRKILGHDNVYPLLFAAQPKIHNPINRNQDKLGKVAFAGTWRDIGHGNRSYHTDMLLKPAIKYGLHIYDRAFNNQSKSLKFPDKYAPYIIGDLPYDEMVNTYKKYDIFLNVNSCEDSPTMFSRRVFELLGCGTNVISSYSSGIEKMFPNIVKICKSQEEVDFYINMLLENDNLRDRLSLLGQREIFCNHTYKHRIEEILSKVYPDFQKSDDPSVSIVTCTNRYNCIDNIFNNYDIQNYKNKELIIVLNNNELDISVYKKKANRYKNIQIYQLDEKKTLGECLNYAIEKSNSDYIAKFDDDDYYGSNYLLDSMNVFKYVDADVVGKLASYIYFRSSKILAIRFSGMENRYVKYVTGPTMVINRKIFNKFGFSHKNQGEDTQFLKDCAANGFKVYATDRFNHTYLRHSQDNQNTWQFDEKKYLKNCVLIAQTEDYKDFVTV